MGAKSMRSWCLCQICSCGFLYSQPDHIPIPVQAAVLWDPPD
uniref:Stabilizer of axonemal microtubules 2 n=1 Tax=Gorilla gorilla gorilla TaxID=9595 RepID=A0A2I2YZ73_GORGO